MSSSAVAGLDEDHSIVERRAANVGGCSSTGSRRPRIRRRTASRSATGGRRSPGARRATVSPARRGLIALGIEPEQRVAIASSTRYEWILADLAIMCVWRGDHHRLPVDRCRGRRLHPQRLRQPRRLRRGRRPGRQAARASRGPARPGHKIVVFDGAGATATGSSAWTTSAGSARDTARRRARASSTTGSTATRPRQPRHADLHLRHHRTAQGRPAAALSLDLRGRRDRGAWTSSAATTCSTSGCRCRTRSARCCSSTQLAVGFPTAVDGRVDKIIDNLAVVKPTFMGAAPRIFEKAHGRIVTMQPSTRAA